jgi:hypothetical protein
VGCVIVGLVAGGLYRAHRQRQGQEGPPKTVPVPVDGQVQAKAPAPPTVKPPETASDAAFSELPGHERPAEPPTQARAVEEIIRPEPGPRHADVQAAQRQLGALDAEKLSVEEKAALRWSLFEKTAHEMICNDTANLLLNAGDRELAGALAAQLLDSGQTALWRNYCVQHLAEGYRRLERQPAVIRVIFRAAEDDPAPEVRDVGLLHLSRLSRECDWAGTQPAWHARASLVAKRFLTEEGRSEIERISGAHAAGELGLTDEAPRLLGWLRERTTPLGQRKAAAGVLPGLGKLCNDNLRGEIAEALKTAAGDSNRLLRQIAEKGLKDLASD